MAAFTARAASVALMLLLATFATTSVNAQIGTCKIGGPDFIKRSACIASCAVQNCGTGYCNGETCTCSRCGTGPAPLPPIPGKGRKLLRAQKVKLAKGEQILDPQNDVMLNN